MEHIFEAGYIVSKTKNSTLSKPLYKVDGVAVLDTNLNIKTVKIDSYSRVVSAAFKCDNNTRQYPRSAFIPGSNDTIHTVTPSSDRCKGNIFWEDGWQYYLLRLEDISLFGFTLDDVKVALKNSSFIKELYKEAYCLYLVAINPKDRDMANLIKVSLPVYSNGELLNSNNYPFALLDGGISNNIWFCLYYNFNNLRIEPCARYGIINRDIMSNYIVIRIVKNKPIKCFHYQYSVGLLGIKNYLPMLKKHSGFIGCNGVYALDADGINGADSLIFPIDCEYIVEIDKVPLNFMENIKAIVINKQFKGYRGDNKGFIGATSLRHIVLSKDLDLYDIINIVSSLYPLVKELNNKIHKIVYNVCCAGGSYNKCIYKIGRALSKYVSDSSKIQQNIRIKFY